MKNQKKFKIAVFICTAIILFSNILPSLSMATIEIVNQIKVEENIITEQNREIEQVQEKTENMEDIKQEEISNEITEEKANTLKEEEEKKSEEIKTSELPKDKVSEIFITKENAKTLQTKQVYSSDRIEVQNLPTYLQTTVNNDVYGEGIYSKRVSVNRRNLSRSILYPMWGKFTRWNFCRV